MIRRPLTIVLPHFCNLGMLAEQQKIWANYPQRLKDALHVVIADDCSPAWQQPTHEHLADVGLASVRLYRLLEKKRWNWLACRNLGAKVATTEWLLLTDIDHAIPTGTLERLLEGPLDERHCYRFNRVTATKTWPYRMSACTPYKMHNDTWLLTKPMFFHDKVGGYDERLSGCYGTSGEFSDRLKAATAAHVILSEPIIRYPREVISDASTLPSVYTRKGDPENDAELKRRKDARAMEGRWKPLHGLVKSELVASIPVHRECVA